MRAGIRVAAFTLGWAFACSSGEEEIPPRPAPEAAEPAPDGGGGGGGRREAREHKRKAKARKRREGGGEPAAGSWPPTVDGVCQMTFDCGCESHPSMGACTRDLGQYEDGALRRDVRQCIVTQDCESMCDGGGVRCIEEGTPSGGGGGGGGGDDTECWPSGITCPAGTTPITNSCGVIVDCR